ncbi:DNA recombination protein RmuC [Cellulomonas sp. P24]|uniref:DNA recombination protein RmuC n=1 Tax=Cellulomonas sp. P24 TaxID=2885206 RepID=UPI00216B022E|nr:DNA recombination protein RmuC [Cellulomonas sp. P24]MCR6493835.1 DNA recombination protein RmuC [Cellulomonas sp. P24]
MSTSTVVLVVTVAVLSGALVGWSLAVARTGTGLRAAQVRAAQAEARLEAERATAAERLGALRSDQDRLSDQFRALAADALASNNEQFLALAHQRLAASQQSQVTELGRSEDAVRQLVEPLARTLDQVKAELTSAQAARLTGQAALGEQVRAMRESSELLRSETAQLVTALRSSQVRGRWGELQLRRVVESAGMLAHVDFVEQASTRTDDGLLRPDMVVRLSGGKNVVVDAKVAFLGYLDAAQTTDEAVRADRLAAHARHVRKHIDDLAAKRYWEQFTPAPEFVVMFIPAEAFFHAAIEQDATIVEYAFERNVIIATPMTLLALLRTVAYAWRQDALASNAQQVLDLGKELHGRLATLGLHVSRLGRALDAAAGAYNQTVSSLETRVLVSARRFADLHVVDGDLPSPPTSDPQLSAVRAPEFVASITEQMVALDVPPGQRATTGT